MKFFDYEGNVYECIENFMHIHEMTPEKIIKKYSKPDKLYADMADKDCITGKISGRCTVNDSITYADLKERVMDNIYKLGQVVKLHAWLDYDHIGYMVCEEDYDTLDVYLRLSVLEDACYDYWCDSYAQYMASLSENEELYCYEIKRLGDYYEYV